MPPVESEVLLVDRLGLEARFIELNGARIRFVESVVPASADEPVWIFVHGIGGRLEDFGPLLEQSAGVAHLVALDLPGFGESSNPRLDFRTESYAETIVRLLDSAGIGRVRLICHSMGGQICLSLALDNSQRVVSLVLVDAAGVYDSSIYAKRALKQRVGLNIGNSTGARNPLIEMLTTDQQTLVKRVFLSKSSPLAAVSSFKTNLRKRIGALRVPTLIIWGTRDEVFPIENAFLLKETLATSELRIIEGGTHLPFRAHSETILQWLVNFHEGTASDRAPASGAPTSKGAEP
jgi:pimeloyl-ACP methyl ester carboxylesterase